MTQRVVAGASAIVFGLLAVMVHLLVSMHDNQFPVALDPPSRITVDFAESSLEGDAAMEALRSWDAGTGVGLVKQTADLDGNLRGRILVPLNDGHSLPETVAWYDDEPAARVAGPEALAHTVPSGSYFVTGDPARLPDLFAKLEQQGVLVTRDDPSVWSGLQGLYRMKSLFIAFVTGCVLLATLVLYWLAVKARSRALRVLGGTSVSRIQIHDLGRLLLLVAAVWLSISAVATVLIGVWKGWIYTPLFATYLGTLGGLMLAVVIVVALIMSKVSIPSPDLIARRQPATAGVRRAAGALKCAAFLLVLLTFGPTWIALSQAAGTAEQMSRWERLADQVTTNFPLLSEAEFQRMMPAYGAAVREADDAGSVAFCLMFQDVLQDQHAWVSRALGERWSSFAMVNQRWLDLVLSPNEQARLANVPREQVPQRFVDEFTPQLELWKRSEEPAIRILAQFKYLTPAGGPVPLIGSGGDLVHRDDVLIILVPGAWATFNDDALLSAASGSKVLFTGLEKTQMLVDSHGLAKEVKVRRAADAGILAAQFAAYEAWLSTVSMVGLAVALVVAALISAYIMALLQARNDFVRRLAGHTWLRVLQKRVGLDAAIAVLLAVAVVSLQPRDQILPVAVAAVLIVLLSPVAHIAAARRGFADIRTRRL